MTEGSPIDAYLAKRPADQQEALGRLRDQVVRLVPAAVQSITYGMPTIKVDDRALLLFAGWKSHCSVYGLSDAFIVEHADELAGYERTKGSLHFTTDAPFPEPLVETMVRSRLSDLESGD